MLAHQLQALLPSRISSRLPLLLILFAVGSCLGIAAEACFDPGRFDSWSTVVAAVIISPLLNLSLAGYVGGDSIQPFLRVYGLLFPLLFPVAAVALMKRPTLIRASITILMTAVWYFGLIARLHMAMSV